MDTAFISIVTRKLWTSSCFRPKEYRFLTSMDMLADNKAPLLGELSDGHGALLCYWSKSQSWRRIIPFQGYLLASASRLRAWALQGLHVLIKHRPPIVFLQDWSHCYAVGRIMMHRCSPCPLVAPLLRVSSRTRLLSIGELNWTT